MNKKFAIKTFVLLSLTAGLLSAYAQPKPGTYGPAPKADATKANVPANVQSVSKSAQDCQKMKPGMAKAGCQARAAANMK